MKLIHRLILTFLIVSALLFVIWIINNAGEYYISSLVERPRLPEHKLWKPGGQIGHGLGIVGSSMMILLLLYSVRKKWRRLRRWGKLSTWLNYHIFLGITGPVLVIFHTSFKFGGLVSISFWSMVAVALSGFIGRYIYIQIPRKISGEEFSLQEVEEQNAEIGKMLKDDFELSDEDIGMIRRISKADKIQKGGIGSIFYIFLSDITGWILLRRLRRTFTKMGEYPKEQLHEMFRLIKAKAKLSRRKAFWQGAHQLFHYWHVVHKPFAFTMLTIMIIHVVVTVTFGYTWVF